MSSSRDTEHINSLVKYRIDRIRYLKVRVRAKGLDAMKEQLRGVFRKYVAEKMTFLQKAQQKFLPPNDSGNECHNSNEGLHDPASYISWPRTMSKPVRAEKPLNVIGGTLEEYIDGDKKVYQLLTPEVVCSSDSSSSIVLICV